MKTNCSFIYLSQSFPPTHQLLLCTLSSFYANRSLNSYIFQLPSPSPSLPPLSFISLDIVLFFCTFSVYFTHVSYVQHIRTYLVSILTLFPIFFKNCSLFGFLVSMSLCKNNNNPPTITIFPLHQLFHLVPYFFPFPFFSFPFLSFL